MKILHITTHLGGGVGRALTGLILNSNPEDHAIVCLERPEKLQFIEKFFDSGCPIIIAPGQKILNNYIEYADIVQLEWWGHPKMAAILRNKSLPAMRSIVWCHTSGLHEPKIPSDLINKSHRFIFTSQHSYMNIITPWVNNKIGVINSVGGFEGFNMPDRSDNEPLKAGYVGTQSFDKLHPDYVEYLAAVDIPNFKVRMIGDSTNYDILTNQCKKIDRSGILQFAGYTNDMASELAKINVMPYILNPLHYGTTENALLEAMAMGVVPIVLNNPAERQIVNHLHTGFIVNSQIKFAAAMEWLYENPLQRKQIGIAAAKSVRERFSIKKTVDAFDYQYKSVMKENKIEINNKKS